MGRSHLSTLALLPLCTLLAACGAHTLPRLTAAPVVPAIEARPLPPPDLPEWTAATILEAARGQLGVAYRSGGTTPAGFDCSGFVQFVLSRAGLLVPRDVKRQFAGGVPVDAAFARPGDLIFFATTGRSASHVGIVVDERTFIHAPSTRGVVRIETLGGRYWRERYVGVRRIVPAEQVIAWPDE